MPRTKKTKEGKPAVKKTTVKEKPYSLKVVLNDEVFETKAETIAKAITEFVNSPVFTSGLKTKVVLTFGDKNMSRTAIYPVPRARKMFSMFAVKGGDAIEIFANQLTRGLV